MDPKQNPTTVAELFPSEWLTADALQGRQVRVIIEAVTFEELRQRDGTHERKAIVAFTGKHKRLVLNKTQATAIAEIAGSDAFADWPGTAVLLKAGTAPNNKPTIIVERG
jgi:hypothetical protein